MPTQDIDGYAQTLAEQGFLLTHWEVVRDLWLDALKSSPYMEAYELRNMELGTGSAAYRFFQLCVLRPMAESIARMEDVYQDDSNAQLVRIEAPHIACSQASASRLHVNLKLPMSSVLCVPTSECSRFCFQSSFFAPRLS